MQPVSHLYDSFQPDNYTLSFVLNRSQRTFEGAVMITGVAKDNGPIKLHAKDLDIMMAKVNGHTVETSQSDDELSLKTDVTPGETYVLALTFAGKITDPMHGIYPCYFEVDGVKKELIATQFESHHAREAFPCIDEPEAKATFDLTLSTEPDITVLGNMPIKKQQNDEDRLVTIFDTTPRMSSYLLAFVVGELQKKSSTTKNGTEVNIYATHAQSAESLDFGLETAVKSIEFFNDYFNTPYPLPKCDHVALPDFSSGAMENWGLITYREMCLLADDTTAISSREYIATVIAHETSHQWFGNLVTMKWWDDLWLNESFATLMEYMAVDAIYPKWNIWMSFATQETLSALRRDYLSGVQAVKTNVHHPDEISSLFDPSIVYAKGARLLKMLHNYIGDEAFQTGLRAYFSSHAYKNTVGDDLWSAFSDAAGLDIGSFMRTWIEQPGLPVVSIQRNPQSLTLTQHRFLVGDHETDTSLWPIPLNAIGNNVPRLFEGQTLEVPIPTSDVLYLNEGNSAHFVTAYDDGSYRDITRAIQQDKLTPIDRLALLHETSLLARSGYTTATALFTLLSAYQHEREEPVWDIISMVIGDLKRFVQEDDEAENRFKKYVVRLALPLFEILGWTPLNNENESDTKLRATILGLLAYGEYPSVVEKGLDIFHTAPKIETIDGELRSVIFSIAAKFGDDIARERLLDLYKTSSVAEIQQDALAGITTTKNHVMLQKLIETITDESIVRAQDVDRWFVYLIRNRDARDATWEWMTSHWDWITKKFDGDKSYDSFPRYAASAFSTFEWKEKYDNFFGDYIDQPALTRAIDLGSKDIAGRAAWIKRDGDDLKSALKKVS